MKFKIQFEKFNNSGLSNKLHLTTPVDENLLEFFSAIEGISFATTNDKYTISFFKGSLFSNDVVAENIRKAFLQKGYTEYDEETGI